MGTRSIDAFTTFDPFLLCTGLLDQLSSVTCVQAVDGAAVQAAAVQFLLQQPKLMTAPTITPTTSPASSASVTSESAVASVPPTAAAPEKPRECDLGRLFARVLSVCETKAMRQVLLLVQESFQQSLKAEPQPDLDRIFLSKLISQFPRPGSALGFQIATVHMTPCVLWIFCRYHASPETALMKVIALGGDTDTAACILGALLGALHGYTWLPKRWLEKLENGARGRDYAVKLADALVKLDLRKQSGSEKP